MAHKAKSAFIANMSHDLRTPLSGMIGMATILMKEIPTQSGQEAVRYLLNASNCLLELINEVIEIAKLDSGYLPVYDVRFSLNDVIDNLLKLIKPSAEEKRLSLKINYDNSIPQAVIGDQIRIHRILLNLVSNAIKFTHKGEITIEVALAAEEKRELVLKLVVRDTGIGVPLEHQHLLYSRFNRLEPSYTGH